MVRYIKKISQKVGLQPGTVVYVGEEHKEPVSINISVIDYDKTEYRKFDVASAEECFLFFKKKHWI